MQNGTGRVVHAREICGCRKCAAWRQEVARREEIAGRPTERLEEETAPASGTWRRRPQPGTTTALVKRYLWIKKVPSEREVAEAMRRLRGSR